MLANFDTHLILEMLGFMKHTLELESDEVDICSCNTLDSSFITPVIPSHSLR